MKVLVLGATGFLGSKITSQLLKVGNEVVGGVRHLKEAKKKFPNLSLLEFDFVKKHSVEEWAGRLTGIDLIINCVGIFYHPDKKVIWAIHYEGPKTVYQAACLAGVKKIIHISALNVDQYQSDYAKSKRAIEKCLKSLTIPSIILRPSFIFGADNRGGMGLIRSLAALPGIIPLPGHGKQRFQPIYIEDLAQAVVNLTYHKAQRDKMILSAVALPTLSLKEMIVLLRRWLGIKTKIFLNVPMFLIKLTAGLGNFFPNTSINSDAIRMLEKGNVAPKKEALKFQEIIGFEPRNFAKYLRDYPSSEAQRWYAKLFPLTPFLRLSLSFMWLASAVTSLLPYTRASSLQLLSVVGIPASLQTVILYAAIVLNGLIGIGLLCKIRLSQLCWVQLMVMGLYTLIITIKLPFLWLEPFGSIVKNIPIMVAVLMLYSMEN